MPDHTISIGMERKLAAIVSMDVVGYSRLTGENEETTIRTLTAHRAVISLLIQQYRGRVVDAPVIICKAKNADQRSSGIESPYCRSAQGEVSIN